MANDDSSGKPLKDPNDPGTGDLIGQLSRIQHRWAEKKRQQASQQEPPSESEATAAAPAPVPAPKAEVIPLFPGWAEEVRAAPDICLRSALFGVVRPGRRRWLQDEQLPTQGGYEVRWNGERLDQGDLDIWLQVLHLMRDQPCGHRIYFSPRAMLRAIGRGTGKSDRDWLFRGLDRMAKGSALLENERFRMVGGLMAWGRDKETDQCFISPSKDFLPLFQPDLFSLLDFERRLSVASQLGRWLHEFYSTHAEPYALRVETLRTLCGSEAGELWKFRQELRYALDELVTVGLLVAWEIDEGDLVRVRKRPTDAQARHLIDRAVTEAISKRKRKAKTKKPRRPEKPPRE